MSGSRARPGNILRGVTLLARGKAEGLSQFASSPQALLSSLAPLIAFPLVGFLLTVIGRPGAAASGLADLLGALCAALAPPVLSYEFARHWHREAGWLRYATALDWCQWVVPLLAALLLTVIYPIVASALPARGALGIVALGIVAYALWLHWFIARHGLMLSGRQAALLVFLVNLGTGLLAIGPRLLMLARAGG